MKKIFVGLSAVVAVCTLLTSIVLYCSVAWPRSSTLVGFNAAIGFYLALLALGCGNLLCFILNLIACWQGFRRPWFINILVIQGIIVTLCLIWVGSNYLERYREGVGREQVRHDPRRNKTR